MTTRPVRFALVLLLVAPLAAAVPAARAESAAAAAPSAGTAPARGKARAPKATARDRGTAAPASKPEHGRPRVAPRMLDATRIEGEIPVPQVLFITARDQRRFLEFQHHRYQVTSLELGRSTPGPSRLVVPTPSPDKAKQEDPR